MYMVRILLSFLLIVLYVDCRSHLLMKQYLEEEELTFLHKLI